MLGQAAEDLMARFRKRSYHLSKCFDLGVYDKIRGLPFDSRYESGEDPFIKDDPSMFEACQKAYEDGRFSVLGENQRMLITPLQQETLHAN